MKVSAIDLPTRVENAIDAYGEFKAAVKVINSNSVDSEYEDIATKMKAYNEKISILDACISSNISSVIVVMNTFNNVISKSFKTFFDEHLNSEFATKNLSEPIAKDGEVFTNFIINDEDGSIEVENDNNYSTSITLAGARDSIIANMISVADIVLIKIKEIDIPTKPILADISKISSEGIIKSLMKDEEMILSVLDEENEELEKFMLRIKKMSDILEGFRNNIKILDSVIERQRNIITSL